MGTGYALAHRTQGKYIKERLIRLGIPLIFGMLVIVPPQVYLERVAYGAFAGSYFDFYPQEAFIGIYPSGNLSWHHLWFLPYLLIYSVLLAPIFIYLRNNTKSGILKFSALLLSKKYGWYYFAIPLILAEIFLEPLFNITHALIGDWFALTNYAILFFYGFLFIKLGDLFWKHIDDIKQTVLIFAVISFALYLGVRMLDDGLFVHIVEATIKVMNFWSWILVLFAYSAKWFNRKSKLIRYCNTAVYPFYILHQTIIIIIAFCIMNWSANFFIKFIILSGGTFLISWLLYEVIRRVFFLRPLFGLKS